MLKKWYYYLIITTFPFARLLFYRDFVGALWPVRSILPPCGEFSAKSQHVLVLFVASELFLIDLSGIVTPLRWCTSGDIRRQLFRAQGALQLRKKSGKKMIFVSRWILSTGDVLKKLSFWKFCCFFYTLFARLI